MTYHTIATDATLWAEHTDDEPFAGTLAERIALKLARKTAGKGCCINIKFPKA